MSGKWQVSLTRVSKSGRFGLLLLAAGFLIIALAAARPACATSLTITPIFDSSITRLPNAAAVEGAVNSAVQFYEKTFSNPVDIPIAFVNDPHVGLGESISLAADIPYQDYVLAMQLESTDAAALANLPNTPNNPVTGTPGLDVNTNELAALGFLVPPQDLGGIVVLNTGLTDISGGPFSLLSTAEHEIDEVLGIGSALGRNLPDPLAEDLYRYQCGSNGIRSYMLDPNAQACFSINGRTDLAQFNQNPIGDYGTGKAAPCRPEFSLRSKTLLPRRLQVHL
ncbi:MAG TPA: NF038122 family metalloprotease [Terriglobia bacterium]|nr:NF038122 family metalloprotease [Terriglobia bacterium]